MHSVGLCRSVIGERRFDRNNEATKLVRSNVVIELAMVQNCLMIIFMFSRNIMRNLKWVFFGFSWMQGFVREDRGGR